MNIEYVRGTAAPAFVERQQALGADCFWETYQKVIVFFRGDDRAITSRSGAFRDGRWGFANRVEIDDDGVFKIDARNVRRNRHRTT